MQSRSVRLRSLPLFRDLEPTELDALLAVFEERRLDAGQILFEAGSRPTHLWLLVEGSLSIRGPGGQVLQLSPPEQVGELSALTGEDRLLTAVTAEPSVLLASTVEALQSFLESHGRIGFVVQRNMLRVAARKIARDRRRLTEMRDNIISTQRAMKSMREALLDSEDTPLHAAFFEQLDALVEQNRKIHYLVEPSRLVPTDVRLDDGSVRRVTALSNEWLFFGNPPPQMSMGAEVRAVLVLDGREVPVSGRVERVTSKEATVFLDELIDEYDDKLTQHLSRAQLLDMVL